MFRVTEVRVRQPACDHDRLRDLRRRIGNASGLFHFMTKSTPGVSGAAARIRVPRGFVGISGEENGALQFPGAGKLSQQLPHLLHGEVIDLRLIR